MRIPDHPTLIHRMLQHRLKKLSTASPILAASLANYRHRCGQPSCRCHRGGPLHAAQHVTFTQGGKTRTVYVPQPLLPEVRTWLAEHHRLKGLLREIHQLPVAPLRARARFLKLKAGRR